MVKNCQKDYNSATSWFEVDRGSKFTLFHYAEEIIDQKPDFFYG